MHANMRRFEIFFLFHIIYLVCVTDNVSAHTLLRRKLLNTTNDTVENTNSNVTGNVTSVQNQTLNGTESLASNETNYTVGQINVTSRGNITSGQNQTLNGTASLASNITNYTAGQTNVTNFGNASTTQNETSYQTDSNTTTENATSARNYTLNASTSPGITTTPLLLTTTPYPSSINDTSENYSNCPPAVYATAPPPAECDCEEKIQYVDNTKASTGMIQSGYEGSFVALIVLSNLTSIGVGFCLGVCYLNGYSKKIAPDGPRKLLRSLSVKSHKGNRLIIQGGGDNGRRNSIEMIEEMHESGQKALRESAAKKKAKMNKRVAERLNSRKNRMAMKLSKSKALEKVECFKYLSPKHMSIVIGKMKLVSYEKGQQLCTQGENASEFFVCMEGLLDVYVHGNLVRSMGELEWLGERALLNQNAKRGATVTATTKSEIFVLSRIAWNDLEKDGVPVKDIQEELKEKMDHYEQEDKRLHDTKMNSLRAEQVVRRASTQGISRGSSSYGYSQELNNDEKVMEEPADVEEDETIEL